MSKAITTAYVFAQSPSGTHELAGTLSQNRTAGSFVYSQHWLEQAGAYPLDPVNLKLHTIPRVEYATMLLAQRCRINIPDIRLHTLGDRDAFIIQRFDRHEKRQLHYISAHSLFNRDRGRLYDDAYADPCSYIALSKILLRSILCQLFHKAANMHWGLGGGVVLRM